MMVIKDADDFIIIMEQIKLQYNVDNSSGAPS